MAARGALRVWLLIAVVLSSSGMTDTCCGARAPASLTVGIDRWYWQPEHLYGGLDEDRNMHPLFVEGELASLRIEAGYLPYWCARNLPKNPRIDVTLAMGGVTVAERYFADGNGTFNEDVQFVVPDGLAAPLTTSVLDQPLVPLELMAEEAGGDVARTAIDVRVVTRNDFEHKVRPDLEVALRRSVLGPWCIETEIPVHFEVPERTLDGFESLGQIQRCAWRGGEVDPYQDAGLAACEVDMTFPDPGTFEIEVVADFGTFSVEVTKNVEVTQSCER